MSAKKGTYAALICLFVLGAGYVYSAVKLGGTSSTTLGPGYFPIILGGALMILCAISGIQNYRKQDKKIAIPNLKVIWITIAAMSVFFLAWYYVGLFYVFTFLFLVFLLTLYNPPKGSGMKVILKNSGVALAVLLFIYLVFDLVLSARF